MSSSSRRNLAVVEEPPTTIDHVRDGFRVLFKDQMPLMVITATLTFPLVVGFGGFLTASSPVFLFPLIAFLPGISVLALIGGMGRRIMTEAAQGIENPPDIPGASTLTLGAARFAFDAVVLSFFFLGPALGASLLGAPLAHVLAIAFAGMLLLPLAMVLRQQCDDWRCLSPAVLGKVFWRSGGSYLGLALAMAMLFVPALAATFVTMGTKLYLQVSVVGPLTVLPIFVAARMLGTWLDAHRGVLKNLIPFACKTATQRRRRNAPVVRRVRHGQSPASNSVRQGGLHRASRPATDRLRSRRKQERRQAPRHPEAERGPLRLQRPISSRISTRSSITSRR